MRSLSDLFRSFVQLGYVTDDIDAAAAYLESAMGTGKCVKSYTSSLGGGRPPASASDPRTAFVVVDGSPADEWLIDVALVNAQAGLIDERLAAALMPPDGPYHVLVQLYLDTEPERVAGVVSAAVAEYREYVRQVAAWTSAANAG